MSTFAAVTEAPYRQQVIERRRQTRDKSVDLVFQSGPLHERLRLETLSLSLSSDGVVDDLGACQPLAALYRARSLHNASRQSIERLPRVRRKLLSVTTHMTVTTMTTTRRYFRLLKTS